TLQRRPGLAGNGSSGCTSQKRRGRRSDSLSYRAPQNLLFIKIDSNFIVIQNRPCCKGGPGFFTIWKYSLFQLGNGDAAFPFAIGAKAEALHLGAPAQVLLHSRPQGAGAFAVD